MNGDIIKHTMKLESEIEMFPTLLESDVKMSYFLGLCTVYLNFVIQLKVGLHPASKFPSDDTLLIHTPGACFLKAPETFRARKAIPKSLFTQEISGIYTSPFLDTDELKMVLRA